jgi:hypothetical protein
MRAGSVPNSPEETTPFTSEVNNQAAGKMRSLVNRLSKPRLSESRLIRWMEPRSP